ncbi:MAG TPA: hypothetical protein VF190_07585 [Rhodothermales bacterium]
MPHRTAAALALALSIGLTLDASAARAPDPPSRTIKVLSYNAYGAVPGPTKVKRCWPRIESPDPELEDPTESCRWETQSGKPFGSGPIELLVTVNGHQSIYWRLKCNGVPAPPDLPPQSDPYAGPCD